MAENDVERSFLRHGHGFQCFGERTNLIDLDQDGVGALFADAAREELGIGHEQIVADQLRGLTQTRGQGFPTTPIIFAKTVLDGANGPTLAPLAPHVDHLLAAGDAIWIALKKLVADFVFFFGLVHQFAGGRVKTNHDVASKFIAGFFHRCGDEIARVLIAFQVWREATFVADGC